jgi:hypothetical protein
MPVVIASKRANESVSRSLEPRGERSRRGRTSSGYDKSSAPVRRFGVSPIPGVRAEAESSAQGDQMIPL